VIVAAWLDSEVFSCAMCERKPTLKATLGCDGPPVDANGQVRSWPFPPEAENRLPEFQLECCPAKYLQGSWDVVELFGAGSTTDWKLSLTERDMLPVPFMDAWILARNHTRMAEADRARRAHG